MCIYFIPLNFEASVRITFCTSNNYRLFSSYFSSIILWLGQSFFTTITTTLHQFVLNTRWLTELSFFQFKSSHPCNQDNLTHRWEIVTFMTSTQVFPFVPAVPARLYLKECEILQKLPCLLLIGALFHVCHLQVFVVSHGSTDLLVIKHLQTTS